jgi:hypothetical protein
MASCEILSKHLVRSASRTYLGLRRMKLKTDSILPLRSLLVGYLLRLCGERRTVPPFRVPTLRDVRPVLYAGSRVGYRLASIGKPGQRTFPFWACLLSCGQIANVGRACLTTTLHTFTCVSHSRLLSGVAASDSRFTAFSSSLSALSLPKG